MNEAGLHTFIGKEFLKLVRQVARETVSKPFPLPQGRSMQMMNVYQMAAWNVVAGLSLMVVGGLVLWAYGARQQRGVLLAIGPEAEAHPRISRQTGPLVLRLWRLRHHDRCGAAVLGGVVFYLGCGTEALLIRIVGEVMIDMLLSEAIVKYLGYGISSYPHPNEKFISKCPPNLLQQIKEIIAEACRTEIDWQQCLLAASGNLVEKRMKELYPQLTENALHALSWNFTFANK